SRDEMERDGMMAQGSLDDQDATALDSETVDGSDEGAGDRGQRYDNNGYNGGGYFSTQTSTQSTVDLNVLMDIIETVFDRPSIHTYVLMSGDRDFTRICARLKLRLNKRVIIVGVPGAVSRDLLRAADQFIPLGGPLPPGSSGAYLSNNSGSYYRYPVPPAQSYASLGPVSAEEPGFIQFLDYIDRHWSWRTIPGIANFIGNEYNPKNRFRGRLNRDSARDLIGECIDKSILISTPDPENGENLRLNREHPDVMAVLTVEQAPEQP
ncbi:MAG TPA: NYN domain-containing protein, partial [Ktedonobacterales bacterium]